MKKRRLDAIKVTEDALMQFKVAIETLEKANALIDTEIGKHGESIVKAKEEIETLEARISNITDEIIRKNDLRNMNIERIENIKSLVGGNC